MIDTYVKSTDKEDLELFVADFVNHTPAIQGVDEHVDEETGTSFPAKGDGAYWYACVRSSCSVAGIISSPLEPCSDEEGQSVIVFA